MAKHRTKAAKRPSLSNLKDETQLTGAAYIQQHYAQRLATATEPQLVEIGRKYLELCREQDLAEHARRDRQQQRETEQERIQREGVTLAGRRLEHARSIVDAVNMTAFAVHGLAQSASAATDPNEAGQYLSAIEDAMVLTCRRADALATYMGDAPGYGNFREDIEAMTPEQAAQLDRAEAEREADHE